MECHRWVFITVQLDGCVRLLDGNSRMVGTVLIVIFGGIDIWLVVSTPLKNISQNGNLPQIGAKIKNI